MLSVWPLPSLSTSRGLGQIDYEVLRKVSDHFMSIPSIALEKVLRVLAGIGFVRLVERGTKIQQVIPNIPVFNDVYEGIGSYASSECELNSHEEVTLAILAELQDAPRNRDALYNTLGVDKVLFNRCLTIGQKSGILSEHLARGRRMLISPYYFSDNLDGLADAAASVGASAIRSALGKIRSNQGWPLALIAAQKEVGGLKLNPTEVALVHKLAEEGVIKPPTIRFATGDHSFIFTPKPGETRLNAANREIYERAMALISAVRKGQLLANQFKIWSPERILEALRDRGYIGSNSEARDQYQNLVVLRVAYLKQTTSDKWQLHLNPTSENKTALDLAINLLRTGALAGMEVNQEARIALTRDEEYIQSLISASELKKRQKQITDEQAASEFEQLLLKFD
jgi:hypothetical protein